MTERCEHPGCETPKDGLRDYCGEHGAQEYQHSAFISTFTYRPYFILRSGVTRYGAEHATEGKAWEEVATILAGKHPAKPEWATPYRAIVEYGVELPTRRPRRVLGAGIGR